MSRIYNFLKLYILLLAALLVAVMAFAQETRQLAVDKPQAIADLRTTEGAALVNAKWWIQPAHIEDKEFYLPGPQKGGGDAMPLYPTGKSIATQSLHPQVGAADFEEGFKEIKSSELESRQGTGFLFRVVQNRTSNSGNYRKVEYFRHNRRI